MSICWELADHRFQLVLARTWGVLSGTSEALFWKVEAFGFTVLIGVILPRTWKVVNEEAVTLLPAKTKDKGIWYIGRGSR